MADKVSFDGPAKLIVVNAGITELNVQADLYSAWKVWALLGNNSRYLQAFRSIGGDPMSSTTNVAGYFFLMNGWRIRPQEADHQLVVTGNLFTEESDNPFIPTIGDYLVTVSMFASSSSTVTQIFTGGSSLTQTEHDQLMGLPGPTLTVDEHTQLMGLPLTTLTTDEHNELMGLFTAMQGMIVEGSLTLVQALRLMLSVLAGKTTGGGTDTLIFRDTLDQVDRITAVVDTEGNRTSVELDPL
jgi:hypothetical protein